MKSDTASTTVGLGKRDSIEAAFNIAAAVGALSTLITAYFWAFPQTYTADIVGRAFGVSVAFASACSLGANFFERARQSTPSFTTGLTITEISAKVFERMMI